ncbi:MAG: porin [Gallionellaceae bacterium]|nr:MAG: porin [Gallionellaceae bacterium]
MQKKIIALAIASAISAPAFASNANVEIYGKAFMTVEAAVTDSKASSSTTRINTNASRLGFKGKEDLGEGLKAFYQYEVQMDADGSAGNGLGKTRNSGAGIESELGTVTMGIWDTPFKLAHNKIELFDNTTGFTTTKTIGMSANAKDFNSRSANSVSYTSPSIAGVKLMGAYIADETTNRKNRISASATFEMDDLYVAAAGETRPDQSTASTADTALRMVAQYRLGDVWVGGAYEMLKINRAASTSYTQNNFELAGSYKLGTSSFGLAYVNAGASDQADTSASQISARYGYTFSKRTEVFAAYSTLTNAKSVKYSLGSGAATNGAIESVMGLGVIHSF